MGLEDDLSTKVPIDAHSGPKLMHHPHEAHNCKEAWPARLNMKKIELNGDLTTNATR